MRDQYAADISDLLKFAFLRAIAANDRTIGVGWYYNPTSDGSTDGCHREYCKEPKWKILDSDLWEALRQQPSQSVAALEKLPIWPPKTRFHRVPVPPPRSRGSWATDMKSALDGSGIIFLDPDNGVGEASERYALIDEVEAMTRAGRAVVVIKFPGRENHETQLAAYHTLLRRNVPVVPIVTARTCVWLHEKKVPRFRWFTVVGADEILAERATQFVHKLNGIEKCKADLICGPQALGGKKEVINRASQPMPAQEGRLPQSAEKSRSITAANMCPECGYRFKGNGFDGIDAHWRAKHERIMPYKDAWPLVKSGKYHRPGLLLRDRPQAPALGLS